jgi:ABC-type transport system involved in multi-copper enzyme maturation permease subunit
MWQLVRHEARALWPIWAATAGVCLAIALVNQQRWILPGYLAYFMGSVALAALAIGHEYTHRTMPALLSQPVARHRLLIAKLLAVLPMLVTLAPLALAIGPRTPPSERGIVEGALSLVTAVSLAPWLTMLCRSPLAGAVFALGVAGGLHLVALGIVILYVKLAGLPGMPLQVFGDRTLVGLMIVSAVAGAIGGWRRFMTLEALDGRGADLSWPRWLRSAMALDDEGLIARATRSQPYWLLVKKELRLQQMSIAVAIINVLFWLAALGLTDGAAVADSILAAVAVLYGGLVAVVIGALAGAEERHLGTLAWQTLLPVAAWRQFAVKIAVALMLSLLLSFVLPLLLARGELGFNWLNATAVLLLTVGSVCISSFCSSGLQAVAVSAPALFVVAVLLGWSLTAARSGPGVAAALMAGLAVLALRVAYVNHRTVRS